MKEFDSVFDESKSQYHGSIHYLKRLDSLCQGLDYLTYTRTRTISHIERTFNLILSFFKELYGKMNQKQKELFTEYLEEMEEYKERSIIEINKNGRSKINIFKLFDRWEFKLREFQADKGLLMPDEDIDEELEQW